MVSVRRLRKFKLPDSPSVVSACSAKLPQCPFQFGRCGDAESVIDISEDYRLAVTVITLSILLVPVRLAADIRAKIVLLPLPYTARASDADHPQRCV